MLTYDFDTAMDKQQIINRTLKLIRPGSIIVFHDNDNGRTIEILDRVIQLSRAKGFVFGDLEAEL